MSAAGDGFAIAPEWPAPQGVRACVTLRTGGVSTGAYASLNLGGHVGDDPANVAENRRRVAARLALPEEPRWLEQVHGTRVLDLDREAVAPADGAVTGRLGVVCTVLTADCLPVLLADRQGRRVGVAHAGWRGLAGGVLPAAVEALGVPGADVVAWLGPAIGPRAFEVGDEVRAAFAERGFAVERSFVRNARGRWLADLYALAAESLARAGVGAVFGGGYCTHSDGDRFFSHRREAPCGRMAALIWKES
ncbi:MAG TPA: peptidoglycan editing factor PgeF [Gammaproteobacteria bacterium]